MKKTISLIAEKREQFGTSASRKLRLQNKIPAIIYGEKKNNECIFINDNLLQKKLQYENLYSQVLNINIDGNTQKVILKNIHRHHYKNKILHIDFQRVNEESEIKINIPFNFLNQKNCIGLKSGGKVNIKLSYEEIKCKAKFLPEFIDIDLTNLNLDENIYLSDIKFPNNISFVSLTKGYNKSIVGVKTPKKLKSDVNKESEEKTENTKSDEK